jgi:hypothetical protein
MHRFYVLYEQSFMSNVIVWDIETVSDLKGYAAANGHEGRGDDEIRAAMGDKFSKAYLSLDYLHWRPVATGTRFEGLTLRPTCRDASVLQFRARLTVAHVWTNSYLATLCSHLTEPVNILRHCFSWSLQ